MDSKKVIIAGSSRNNGNTIKIVENISEKYKLDIVNLNGHKFSYYDYESKNKNDDFSPLIKNIIEKYDTLIFEIPIYWHSMSGVMKVYFDRFLDLIRIEKETGRKLKGKNMYVISNAHNRKIKDRFYISFEKSANYLGMNYLGNQHFNADKFNKVATIKLDFIK